MSKAPKIAIVYDWLDTVHGGAEQVLLALHEAFPSSELYVSHHVRENTPWIGTWAVHTTWLQHFPAWLRKRRILMGLSTLAFESVDLSHFEVIISVTSATAKGILTRPDQLHICYLLTPPRYLYTHQQNYLTSPIWSNLLRPITTYLCRWDQVAQRRPDLVIPISLLIQRRAHEIYGMATEQPLYPPVRVSDTNSFTTTSFPDKYFSIVSRLVSYKKLETAITACIELQRNVVVIGSGPAQNKLRQQGDSTYVTWLGTQDDTEVRNWLHGAEALLMPGEEDFGIVALEAAAVGTPSILHHKSGVAEILTQKTAVHLEDDTVTSMKKALLEFDKNHFSPQQLQQIAQKYATTSFVRHWQKVVTQLWTDHTHASKGHS